MWKLITGKNERLPELLVVLAVTGIMAAILLPAVTGTHGNAVNAQSNTGILMDGPVSSATESRDARRERREDTEPAVEAVVEEPGAAVDEADPAGEDVEPAAKTVEQTGLEKIRTTDISYVSP